MTFIIIFPTICNYTQNTLINFVNANVYQSFRRSFEQGKVL